MNRYLVISSDCHAGLPNEQYRPYLEAKYHGAFDEFMAQRAAMRAQMAESGFGNKDFADDWFEENEEGLRGSWDASRRDKELDGDGVAGEVIFPDADAVSGGASAPFGAGLGMSFAEDPELLMAGARAHHRWLAELCAVSPERRAGVALAPILDDVDLAAEEIKRAHDSGIRGGILIPSLWNDHPPYHDRLYDPIWEICQDLEMPIHTHSGAAQHADYGTEAGHIGMYITEVRWWSSRPLWFLMWSGVFERFPDLKYVVTECGSFWVADLLWMMDQTFDREHGAKKLSATATGLLTMRPSEYFDRNCAIGSSNTRRRELARRFEIGVENMMWGSDFPHPEGTWPHTREFLRKAFWDMPEDETAQILGLNAANFYGFDVGKLQTLADTIGPTPTDLGQGDSSELTKWDALREAGRPWVTGKEAIPAAVVG